MPVVLGWEVKGVTVALQADITAWLGFEKRKEEKNIKSKTKLAKTKPLNRLGIV
jgi:hypothetical protein